MEGTASDAELPPRQTEAGHRIEELADVVVAAGVRVSAADVGSPGERCSPPFEGLRARVAIRYLREQRRIVEAVACPACCSEFSGARGGLCGVPNVTKENRAFEMPHLLGRKRICPLCTGGVFRKGESGLLDAPLRLVGLQPVRCVNCWRRYYCRGGVAVGE